MHQLFEVTENERVELFEEQPYTSTHVFRQEKMSDMSQEVMEHIIGPMPLKEFVDRFFRSEHLGKEQTISNKFNEEIRKMEACTKEEQMYGLFASAVNIACPNYPAHDIHEKPFQIFKGITINPDVAFFPKERFKEENENFKNVEMLAEFKIIDDDDAFSVKPNKDENGQYTRPLSLNTFETNIEKLSGQSRDTLGQITSYAAAQRSAQFGTHTFSFLLFKKHGRIMFWDYSGVVVTERFSLTDEYFLEFFLRYNDATPEQRGLDKTVTSLSDDEDRSTCASGLFNSDAGLVKMSVGQTEYVVQRYKVRSRSLFGRCTRGFVAYPLDKLSNSTSPVYIKDTWRITTFGREDRIYKHLNRNQISFIPTMVEAADIEGQTTICQDIAANSPWGIGKPNEFQKLQHFRLVLSEIGSALTTFRSAKELVSVFRDALEAHREAYVKAGILHRDISVGNILIGPDRRGLLIDWDVSIHRDETSTKRCGTRPFMAARLLTPTFTYERDEQPQVPSFVDDLESFLHTLTWITFRYTPTKYESDMLTAWLTTTYGERENERLAKTQHFASLNYVFGALYHLPDSPLRKLLYTLTEVMSSRYVDYPKPREAGYSKETDEQYAKRLQSYNKNMGYLQPGSAWMVREFETILERASWTKSDVAKKNSLEQPASTIRLKCSSEICNFPC